VVEQRIRNARVVGSNPITGSKKKSRVPAIGWDPFVVRKASTFVEMNRSLFFLSDDLQELAASKKNNHNRIRPEAAKV